MKNRKKNIAIFSIIAILVPLLIWQQNHSIKRKAKEGYLRFYSLAINGKVTKQSSSSGLSFFIINNLDEKFAISAIPLEQNPKDLFYITIEPGDSIIKVAKTDTFRLIKSNMVYYYTCYKY